MRTLAISSALILVLLGSTAASCADSPDWLDRVGLTDSGHQTVLVMAKLAWVESELEAKRGRLWTTGERPDDWLRGDFPGDVRSFLPRDRKIPGAAGGRFHF